MGKQAENDTTQIEIVANPIEMRKKAEEVSASIRIMKRKFSAIENKVMASKQYWTGDSGKMHRSAYKEKIEEFQMMLETLETHTAKLQKVAKGYDEVESTVVEQVKELPTNVLR